MTKERTPSDDKMKNKKRRTIGTVQNKKRNIAETGRINNPYTNT